jgi:hypothetical protein
MRASSLSKSAHHACARMRAKSSSCSKSHSRTTNPKPQTPNPNPQTTNPKPQTPNPKRMRHLEHAIQHILRLLAAQYLLLEVRGHVTVVTV